MLFMASTSWKIFACAAVIYRRSWLIGRPCSCSSRSATCECIAFPVPRGAQALRHPWAKGDTAHYDPQDKAARAAPTSGSRSAQRNSWNVATYSVTELASRSKYHTSLPREKHEFVEPALLGSSAAPARTASVARAPILPMRKDVEKRSRETRAAHPVHPAQGQRLLTTFNVSPYKFCSEFAKRGTCPRPDCRYEH